MSLKGKIKSNPFNSQGKKIKRKKKKIHLNVRKALAKSKEDLDYKCIAEKGLWNPTEGVF